ncbi:MAG: endonuclease III [Chloroflexi bacterium]|nr:endonuclease III [Chloroflexota bacterium]
MVRASVEQILTLLTKEYGRRNWRRRQSPIEVLVQTILSQNTSDRNSGKAFEQLLASFGSWEDMANASVGEISHSIKAGGLGVVKARYIKQALEEIRRRRGDFELDFLGKLPVDEARDWLRQLPGVGMKTASCVLLFSLGMPALPVDTHVFRVAKRLGLISSKVSVEQAHRLLEALLPSQDVYQFHVMLIEHGRRICKAQRPRCKECVLGGLCPSYAWLGKQEGRD